MDYSNSARELLLSCKGAHQNEKAKKRKLILEEISEIKRKKLEVEQCILSLKTGIEKYNIQAENETRHVSSDKGKFISKNSYWEGKYCTNFWQSNWEVSRWQWYTIEVYLIHLCRNLVLYVLSFSKCILKSRFSSYPW